MTIALCLNLQYYEDRNNSLIIQKRCFLFISILSSILRIASPLTDVTIPKMLRVKSTIKNRKQFFKRRVGSGCRHDCNKQKDQDAYNPKDKPKFTRIPSEYPSISPSNNPTSLPSLNPTYSPSEYPTDNPTLYPSYIPTITPSKTISMIPSKIPTIIPSSNPSAIPTLKSSSNPSLMPSIYPTMYPSLKQSSHPSINSIPISSKPTIVVVRQNNTSEILEYLPSGNIDVSQDNKGTFLLLSIPISFGVILMICLIFVIGRRNRRNSKTPLVDDDYLCMEGNYDMSQLDSTRVTVLQYYNSSIFEYINNQREFSCSISNKFQEMTHEEVISKLSPFLDYSGEIVGEPLMQFVATLPSTNHDEIEIESLNFISSNEVLGTVDAQIKLREDSSCNSLVGDIPYPHVRIKNIFVHEHNRKKLIASTLVKAVADYASEQAVSSIVLQLDHGNNRLIQLENYQNT